MNASGMFLVPGDADMGEHIVSINKSGPQYIFPLKKRRVQIYTQEMLRHIILPGRPLSW